VERRMIIAHSPVSPQPNISGSGHSQEQRLDSKPVRSSRDGTKPAQQKVFVEVEKRALREALIAHFSLGELELLCSDVEQSLANDGINLQLDLDIIGGDSKPVRVLNLITYLDRRGYLSYLVEEIRRQRPLITF